MKTTSPSTFMELGCVHEELKKLFHGHQCALLDLDFKKAGILLDSYGELLQRHIREEEEILLPLYGKRAVEIRGGDAGLFHLEHKKILEFLDRLRIRQARLERARPLPQEILALLDDEARYKQLMEHHYLREERILFPELDRMTQEKEKSALFRLISFSPEESSL